LGATAGQAAALDIAEPSAAAIRKNRFCEVESFRAKRLQLALDGLAGMGLATASNLSAIKNLVAETREPLDRAICGLALMDEGALAESLVKIFQIDRFDACKTIDPAFARNMNSAFLAARRVFPFANGDGVVRVACADPTDLTGLTGCEFAFRKKAIPSIATGSELDALFRLIESGDEALADVEPHSEFEGDAARLKDLASAEPAVRKCNSLISEAVKARASDIHIEPEERSYRVRLRVDGALAERESLSKRQGLAIISRFKILSNLDIAERRRPQDGRFTFPIAGRPVDLRISVTPNVHGEGVVLRLLQREDVELDLSALGFTEETVTKLHRLSDRPNGILLLTGPTGSGKTTTLYALLRRHARRDVKILTIEDPVEYRIAGISQCQTNPAIGLTFTNALRSFLRHDPDIIMVGEMRDLETAKTAVQAALTGHLVLSTLHTNDAPSAVMRLLDMGVEDYLVASTLIGAVGQRLVRKICAQCSGASGPRALTDPVCANCNGAGFHGRLAIAEILEIDDALRAAITAEPTAAKLTRVARAAGFRSMRDDGDVKIAHGLTTDSEVLKAVAE